MLAREGMGRTQRTGQSLHNAPISIVPMECCVHRLTASVEGVRDVVTRGSKESLAEML